AVGLDHIAVERDLTFAQCPEVDYRAQAAADQTLDFLRAARLLAACRFTVAARMRRARQHAVFGRNPALTLALEERRHAFFDARGAQHLGMAEGDKHAAFGMARVMARDAEFAQRIGAAAAGSGHENSF